MTRTDSEPRLKGATLTLAIVSAALLLAISTWLTGSAVAPDLIRRWALSGTEAALLSTSVQLGFVIGTLLFAALNLADLFNPRAVFFLSALAGAGLNAGFAFTDSLLPALVFRVLTGVSFAGVYPVGMKIIAGWYRGGLGWRLGFLIGAFTLGTAAPWLVRSLDDDLPWRAATLVSSAAAALGGVLVLLGVREGPYLRERAKFDMRAMLHVFRHRPFRLAAFGYFGHMWELYTFWTLAYLFIVAARLPEAEADWLVFAAIAAGAVGCVGGGWLSRFVGERRVALWALAASGLCCAISPLLIDAPAVVIGAFVVFWGVVVVADSAQFSALAVRHCPAVYTGTALTAMNTGGFILSIVSIQLIPLLAEALGWRWAFLFLVIGPAFGVLCLARLRLIQH